MRSYLPIVLRAYTERQTKPTPNPKIRRQPEPKWPDVVLILDTETTTDPTQRLLFGSYRYCRWKDRLLQCVEEGIFYADELPESSPDGFACLQRYVREHQADVIRGARQGFLLVSRHDFVTQKFLPAAYEGRALVVGFNLPFDLARLAIDWKAARKLYEGEFSLPLCEYQKDGVKQENLFKPRLCFKSIDSKRSLMGFARPRGEARTEGDYFFGYLLDARTLAFSLTNEGYPLEKACEAFKVEHPKKAAEEHGRITAKYIDYNRHDVRATKELLEKLRAEFDLHEIDLRPYKARSPASIAKAYLRKMGIIPPAKKFSNISAEFLGHAMTAYFGGRAECRIRNTIVPVVYCDFLSMYPTVNALMGLWSFLTARGLKLVDATEEAKRFLERVTFDDCFKQNTWRELLFFADIIPDADVLPLRSSYDEATDAFNIGINPLKSDEPLCYAGPDLVASKFLSGKVPSVVRAYRLAPQGQQSGLRCVRLRSAIPIDPRKQDFFRLVIEQRKRLKDGGPLGSFLKVLANSGSYGIFAEMSRQELSPGKLEEIAVWGLNGKFTAESNAPEEPGEFCFPPRAALITAAARMMLALLEKCVTDLDGTYAFCDTDSMAIVASKTGGPIICPNGPYDGHVKALSWKEADAIVARFESLNPYDRGAVPGSILKIEKENIDKATNSRRQLYCYSISAKRYSLFNKDGENE